MAISKKNKTLQVTIAEGLYNYLEALASTSGDSKSKWISWTIILLRDIQEGNVSLVSNKGKEEEDNVKVN